MTDEQPGNQGTNAIENAEIRRIQPHDHALLLGMGITTWLTTTGIEPPSSDTGAYSKARGRLPESLLQRLIPETANPLALFQRLS